MAVWVVKPGMYGVFQQRMLEKSVVGVGWDDLPDLSRGSDSGNDWVVWVLVPMAFAAGTLLAGAYFWARGRA